MAMLKETQEESLMHNNLLLHILVALVVACYEQEQKVTAINCVGNYA
jgi:hypothetical protein